MYTEQNVELVTLHFYSSFESKIRLCKLRASINQPRLCQDCRSVNLTRKDMALSAISMNSALAEKEFVLSLHHKLHVSTCINNPNDVHKHNQSIFHSINPSIIFT